MGMCYLRECTVLMVAKNVTTAAGDRDHVCHLNCFLCGTLPLPHRAAPLRTGEQGVLAYPVFRPTVSMVDEWL